MKMICSHCEGAVKGAPRYCPHCGARLGSARSGQALLIVMVVVVGIAASFGGLMKADEYCPCMVGVSPARAPQAR